MLTVGPADDLAAVCCFLLRDAAYAAYALGDMEPPYAQHARWHIAQDGGEIAGVALVYDGFDPPALFLMGGDAALRALLASDAAPGNALLLAPAGTAELLSDTYALSHVQHMTRMRVKPQTFAPPPGSPPFPTQRLHPADASAVTALIEETAALDAREMSDIAFDTGMLGSGVYFGAEADGKLVALAGTHLIAPNAGLAALGNVMTHPAHRGRRLATHLSAAVVAALFERGIGTVVLNVRTGNTPAERVYRRLGFEAVSAFLEANGERAARRTPEARYNPPRD